MYRSQFPTENDKIIKPKPCHDTTHLVINQLFRIIILFQQLDELNDIRIIRVELITRAIEANHQSATIVFGGDDRWEHNWIDCVFLPQGRGRLVFCKDLRSRARLNRGVRESYCGVVHSPRGGEHSGLLNVAGQIDTAICRHGRVKWGRIQEQSLERWGIYSSCG